MFGMGTGITSPLWPLALLTMQYEVRKFHEGSTQDGILSEERVCFKYVLNGNDDMAKSHDLLVMLG